MKLIDNESLDRQIGVVAEVAGYLWERGWAERNGGNISVNVTGLCADAVCELPALDGPYPFPNRCRTSRAAVFWSRARDAACVMWRRSRWRTSR